MLSSYLVVPSKEACDGFGWCQLYIFSHMKIGGKDVCFAPPEPEFVIGVLKKNIRRNPYKKYNNVHNILL
jgi:hypothetical protein